MGFLWEDSTGARAVKYLRGQEQGTELETNDFAAALQVKAGALYQLLANAVKLRYIKKVRGPGQSIRWKLGAASDSATIERRKTAAMLTPEELERRRVANAARRARADARNAAQPPVPSRPVIDWPPGFVSAFGAPVERYRPPALAIDEPDVVADPDEPLPVWLRGLVVNPAAVDLEPPRVPRPLQLPLFDPAEIGPGGRARWRRLDLEIPEHRLASNGAFWRQMTFLDA